MTDGELTLGMSPLIHTPFPHISETKPTHAKTSLSPTSFGVFSLALTLIPIVNIFFVISNTIGAALWAVDLERQVKASPADAQKDVFLAANEEARKEWRRIEQ